MPKQKKNQLNENPDESSSSENVVDEEVQPHGDSTAMDKILAGASQNLNAPHKGESRATKWRNSRDKKSGAQQEDISNFIVTILTLVLSAWQIPQDLKPTPDEVNAFSVPATKLLMRHVNLTGKLTQDALDIIGMVAAISSYGVRTNAGWKKYREQKLAESAALDDSYKIPAESPAQL